MVTVLEHQKKLFSKLFSNQGEDTEDWAFTEPGEMEVSMTNVSYNNLLDSPFFPQEICEGVNSSDAHKVISRLQNFG